MYNVIDEVIGLGELYSFPGPSPVNRSHHKNLDTGGSFYNGILKRDAMAFANAYTLPDSARRLYAALTADLPVFTNASKRRVRHHREYGDVISDFAAFETFRAGLTRDIAFWSDQHRQERRQHGVVSIGVNTSTICNQVQSELEFRGAAAMALADYLEALGYRVQMFALIGMRFTTWQYDAAVEIKSASGLMSENGMAFCCDVGIWRHFYFEHASSLPNDVGYGYGYPRDYASKTVTPDVTVPRSMSTEDEARAWLDQTIAKLRERGE